MTTVKFIAFYYSLFEENMFAHKTIFIGILLLELKLKLVVYLSLNIIYYDEMNESKIIIGKWDENLVDIRNGLLNNTHSMDFKLYISLFFYTISNEIQKPQDNR